MNCLRHLRKKCIDWRRHFNSTSILLLIKSCRLEFAIFCYIKVNFYLLDDAYIYLEQNVRLHGRFLLKAMNGLSSDFQRCRLEASPETPVPFESS
jgi:hypothetical protein